MQYPTHFIFNSDYPFDMIVYYKYLEYTKGTSPTELEHHLGFAPLLFGSWSDKEDFSTAYTLATDAYGLVGSDRVSLSVASDDSKVYIKNGATGKKLYLKIYGFAPTSWTGECKPTAQSNSALLLNTDNNYAPLLAAGAVQPKDLSQGGGQTTTLMAVIGKEGYQEINGRDNPVALYYQEPLSPMLMMWKTTASTGKTEFVINAALHSLGLNMSAYPSASYITAGAQGSGQMALQLSTGASRPGQANFDDITHFRVYG